MNYFVSLLQWGMTHHWIITADSPEEAIYRIKAQAAYLVATSNSPSVKRMYGGILRSNRYEVDVSAIGLGIA